MDYIPIRNSNIQDDTKIFFPVPADGALTLNDLRSAFPSITSLRYLDSEDERQHHILCRENTFLEPVDGWKKSGRTYLAVCGSIAQESSRYGVFESYRRQLTARPQPPHSTAQKAPVRSRDCSTTMLTVGHGHFKSGRFTRISATSLSSCGGLVVVGPFSTTTNTSEEIRLAAYEKFCRQNRMFRKKYKSSDQLYLLFPDGSRVEGLPNRKDANIEYRNFVDPTKRFDRLRLYLCDKVNFELSQPFTILTDSSSDENLPSSLMPTQKRDTPSPATCQKEANTSSDDDTLPLVIEVVFHHESTTISETFPNNTLGSVLIAYVAGLENLPVSSTVLRIKESDVIIQAEKRLFELTDLSSTIHVCVEQKTMGTDVEEVSNSLPIRAKYETENDEDVVAEGLVRHTLRLMDNVSEPKEILRRYQSVFLQGRTLDLTSDEETIEGETTPLYIRRVELFKDAVEELKYQENIRLPLEINFCGEAAQDLGGPRREFSHISINMRKTISWKHIRTMSSCVMSMKRLLQDSISSTEDC
ncbi:uncharacterized protein LOC117332638 [Pecten maximus]|uniref:uncharacterized protein LOC117332638 n=1 Tax=Pecten maximus TaxID=6579 RepID=UPI00145859C8|nr:uncharacterized protein LOC117332638 [Pecten maximus]